MHLDNLCQCQVSFYLRAVDEVYGIHNKAVLQQGRKVHDPGVHALDLLDPEAV